MRYYETRISQIEGLTRLDPEYYDPRYTSITSRVRTASDTRVKHVFRISLGPAYSSSSFGINGEIPIAKIGDVTNKRSYNEWERLTTREFVKYGEDNIERDAILLTMTGDPPDVGKVFTPLPAGTACKPILAYNQRVAKLNSRGVNQYYLYAFLSSEYFRKRIEQCALGIRQRNVSVPDLKNAYVFIPDDPKHIEEVADCIAKHFQSRQQSQELYTRAYLLYGSELGLDEVTLNKSIECTRQYSTISLSDTFRAVRFDAQCFTPDAVYYEDWLLKHARCDRLAFLLDGTNKGQKQMETKTGSADYCSIKHISSMEIVGAAKCHPSKNTPLAIRDDLLLAITGATIGKVGIVKRYDKLAFSGDLLRLQVKEEIDPHYMLLVLNHRIGQVQFSRWITGSTNGHLAPRDVKRILVPRLDSSSEDRIAELIKESLSKRAESEHLLNQAVAHVEQLIEEAASS